MAKILSLIYYGERAALEVSAQLVPLVEDEQAKFVLACQVIEEAKHVSAFRRLLKKLDEIHPANPWVRRVLSRSGARRGTPRSSWSACSSSSRTSPISCSTSSTSTCRIRSSARCSSTSVATRRSTPPWRCSICRRSCSRSASSSRTCCGPSRSTGPSASRRRSGITGDEAAALGIDIQQGLRKGIAAQDHLVEQMGIRRGIFKSKTLENLVLSVYDRDKRGKWTPHRSRTSSSS